MVDGPKSADYVGYSHWWPKVTNIKAYNYGWTTLPVAQFVYGQQEVLSWDYITPSQTGVVFPNLQLPFRFAMGKTKAGSLFAIDLYGYNTPSWSASKATFSWSLYIAGAHPNEKGQWSFLNWLTQIPVTFSNTAFKGFTVNANKSPWSCYTSVRANITLETPSGETIQSYLMSNPLALTELADEIISQLYQYLSENGGHTSSYRVGYVPIWAYKTAQPPIYMKSSKLASFRSGLLEKLALSEPSFLRNQILGDATVSAANSAKKFEGNMIAYVKEAVAIKESISGILKLLKGKPNKKTLASIWLSSRYGITLTIRDTNDLISSVKQEIGELGKVYYTCRGGSLSDDVVAHAKLYYSPSQQNDMFSWIEKLYSWDLLPTLDNLWDLVPYSFVVDWFLNVSDILDGIDSWGYSSVMHVFSTCYSLKHTWQPELLWSTAKVVGNITATHYERLTPLEPYQYVPHFSGSLPSQINVIDGASLIIQRT